MSKSTFQFFSGSKPITSADFEELVGVGGDVTKKNDTGVKRKRMDSDQNINYEDHEENIEGNSNEGDELDSEDFSFKPKEEKLFNTINEREEEAK